MKEFELDMLSNLQYDNFYNKKVLFKINEYCRLLNMILILCLQYIYKLIFDYILYMQYIFLYKVFM